MSLTIVKVTTEQDQSMPSRYKMLPNRKKPEPPFRPLQRSTQPDWQLRADYPSREPTTHATGKVESRPLANATIAPAYNKGAYQVIPNSDIKFIGR